MYKAYENHVTEIKPIEPGFRAKCKETSSGRLNTARVQSFINVWKMIVLDVSKKKRKEKKNISKLVEAQICIHANESTV